MIKFQKNNNLDIKNEEIKKRVNEIYELIEDGNILGYATINEDKDNLIYVHIKKEYRGNRIWEIII